MTGPSDKAVEAAFGAMYGPYTTTMPREARRAIAADALDAAYPVIRADVIAEVVAALRAATDRPEDECSFYEHGWHEAADFIEREFGAAA